VARGCCDRRPDCHGRRCLAVRRIVGYPTKCLRITGAHTTHSGGGEDRDCAARRRYAFRQNVTAARTVAD